MATEPWTDMAFDPLLYERNRKRYPQEKLEPFWGRHVAWSLDGSRILADGGTPDELDQRLKELGIDPLMTVDSFVHDPNVSYI